MTNILTDDRCNDTKPPKFPSVIPKTKCIFDAKQINHWRKTDETGHSLILKSIQSAIKNCSIKLSEIDLLVYLPVHILHYWL